MTHTPARPTKKNPHFAASAALTAVRTLFRVAGPIAPHAMSRFAYKLWFTPRRHRRPGWEQDLARKAEETYHVTARGQNVPVWAWGKGPTVLLVHGWEGRGTQLGSFVTPLLEKGFRVVCFDAPAHGDASGKMTDILEIRAAIDAVAAVEGGLHAVISHSFGAVPLSYAVREGLDLRRAVFISPPSELNTMLGIFQKGLAIPNKVMTLMKQHIEGRFPELGKRLWDDLSTHTNARHFTLPGMVVHDRDDRVVPIQQGRLVVEAWQAVDHLETQGLGHRRILRDPTVVNRITGFLTAP